MSSKKPTKARQSRADIAAETLRILERGHYRTDAGTVHIASDLDRAIQGTQLYTPGGGVPIPDAQHQTDFSVENETTLAGCRRLVAAGHDVAALNFASARNPGGGFRKGSQAQEESIARASGLFACVEGNEMYVYNRHHRHPLYSDHMI
ncbi:MAG: hypothetical protein ACI8RZ_006125, partial [Myxococcota bacterium]